MPSNTIHYYFETAKPEDKFIELKRLTVYLDMIGSESMSKYLEVLELEKNLEFP